MSFAEGAVGTATMPSFDMKSVYSHSFGLKSDNTQYVNVWKGVDSRKELKGWFSAGVQKALSSTTGGAGTAGNAMVPVFVDQRIVDVTRKETPLVELIPRVTNMGLTADYNRLETKGGAVTAGEDAALLETNDTYDRASKAIKFLYSVGRVTGPAQSAYPAYMLGGAIPSGSGLGGTPFSDASAPNALQLEIVVKAQSLREKEEDLIINGNSGSDSTEFDGIIVQQSTTNQRDLSGAALAYEDLEESIKTAFSSGGRPKLGVASPSALVAIRKLMIDLFRYTPAQMAGASLLPFGVSAALAYESMLGPIPIIPSRFLSDTAGARQVWFLDTDWIEMRVLLDMTYEPLAKTNDSTKFMLKMYECLIVRAPEFNSYIDNIA